MVNSLTDRLYRPATVLDADPVIHAGQVRLTVQDFLIDVVEPLGRVINIVYHFALLIIRRVAEYHSGGAIYGAFAAASLSARIGAYSRPSGDPEMFAITSAIDMPWLARVCQYDAPGRSAVRPR